MNTAAGSIVFNGAVTWSSNATFGGATAYTALAIDNQATGSVTLSNGININGSSSGAFAVTLTASNDAAGTLSLGSVTASVGSAGSGATIAMNVQNQAANGVMNLAGGTIGTLTNGNATAVTNVTGTLTVTGALTNAGSMAISGNTVTLSGAVAHNNSGTVTSTSAGGFSVTANASFTGGGTLPNVTVTSGTTTFAGNETAGNVTVTGALTIATTIKLAVQSLTETGNITLTAGVGTELDVAGNFTRTSGTFSAGSPSLLKFNGTTAQALNSGPNFQVASLEFNNVTGTITLATSIRASVAVTIDANTNVALGTLNLILNVAGATITNNGTYTASGGGGVILGGATLGIVGGAAIATSAISGSGTFSYITVDVGTGNTATVNGAVAFNGVLTLQSGTLNVAAAGDLSPTGTSASVVRNMVAANGAVLTTTGTFDALNTDYDLTYTGALGAPAIVATGSSEFVAAHVRNLTISTTAFTLTLTSGAAVTIKGNLTLSANALFVFDAGLPYNATVNGTLNVGTGATLSGGAAANTITLAGDSQSHVVAGTISAASILTETGNGSTLNGTGVATDQATIANLDFEPAANSATFSSSNLFQITGAVTVQGTTSATGATATVAMNGTKSTLTGNLSVGSGTASPTVAVTIARNDNVGPYRQYYRSRWYLDIHARWCKQRAYRHRYADCWYVNTWKQC